MHVRSWLCLAAAIFGSNAALPQLTNIAVTGTRNPVTTGPIVIPSTDLAVRVTWTSDSTPTAGKVQIRLEDGTVLGEQTVTAARLAVAGVKTGDTTYSYDTLPFVVPADGYAQNSLTWNVYASLTNADGTTDTSNANNAAVTKTFGVTYTAGPAVLYQTTAAGAANCDVANSNAANTGKTAITVCPGTVVELPAAPAATELTLPSTAPAKIKGATSAFAVSSTVTTTGLNPVTGTVCHTLESLAVTVSDITLHSPLCLLNTELILNKDVTVVGTETMLIKGGGTSKVTIPAGKTITVDKFLDLNVLTEVKGTLTSITAGLPVNVIGSGKLSLTESGSVVNVNAANALQVNMQSTKNIVGKDQVGASQPSAANVGLELIGAGCKVDGAGSIKIVNGVARVNSKSFIVPAASVGGTATNEPAGKATGKAHPQQTPATPIGGPTASLAVAAYTKGATTYKCGAPAAGTTFTTLNLENNGAFFVSQSCDDTTAAAVTLPPAGTDATALKVAASANALNFNGGKLVFLDVKKGGAILDVTAGAGIAKSATPGSIEVQLVGENMPSAAFKIYLMRYKYAAGGAACDIGITATILNAPAGRTPMQGCEAADGANFALFVSIPAVNPVTASNTNQTQSQPYKSLNRYTVTMGRECNTVSADTVKRDLTGIVNTNSISDLKIVCGSAIVSFICLDAQSAAAADATCRAVLDAANGNLRALWNTQSTSYEPVNKGTASNTGLYALFVLVLIPIFCIFCICVLLRNKRRRADNQYKQDTATFANVASSPQPLNVLQPGSPYATVTKPFEGYELQPQPAAYPQQLPPVALNGAAQAPYGY